MFIFLFFPLVSGQNYPGALCNVTYSVPVSCNEVTSKIVAQIDLWNEDKSCPGRCEERNSLSPQRGPPLEPVLLQGSGEECTKCPCGQQCLYVARGVEDNVIRASHITPVIRYKDDLFFRVSDGENGSCDVFGHSHSTGPAYYDFTTNYCNLRNLMTGSGLADLDGYSNLFHLVHDILSTLENLLQELKVALQKVPCCYDTGAHCHPNLSSLSWRGVFLKFSLVAHQATRAMSL